MERRRLRPEGPQSLEPRPTAWVAGGQNLFSSPEGAESCGPSGRAGVGALLGALLSRRGELRQAYPARRVVDQLLQPASPRLVLLGADDPPEGGAAVGGGLGFEVLPGCGVGAEGRLVLLGERDLLLLEGV